MHRSKSRLAWAAWELETVKHSGATLSELVHMLADRTPDAIKRKRNMLLPQVSRPGAVVTGKEVGPPAWTEQDLGMLRLDMSAKDLVVLMSKPRSVWSINHKRRELSIDRPAIGRRALSPSDYPDIDWSLSDNRIHKSTGLCRQTVAKLRRLALGDAPDG